jgi:hypothetical protein
MTMQQLAPIGGAPARNGRLARDEAFGLYVGRVATRAAGGARRRRSGYPRTALRPAWPRTRRTTGHALLAAAFASVATVIAGLLSGTALVGRAETAGLKAQPAARLAQQATAARTLARGPLVVSAFVVAAPSAQTPLHISIAQSGDVPAGAFVRVQGLPPATSLSRGHAMGPGAWAVPLAELADLRMKAAPDASGNAKLTFTLVAQRGEQLAQAQTMLVPHAPQPASSASGGALAKLDPDPARLTPRVAHGDVASVLSHAVRDATPRLVPAPVARRKQQQPVRHVAKRNQQMATRARKGKAVAQNRVARVPAG